MECLPRDIRGVYYLGSLLECPDLGEQKETIHHNIVIHWAEAKHMTHRAEEREEGKESGRCSVERSMGQFLHDVCLAHVWLHAHLLHLLEHAEQ